VPPEPIAGYITLGRGVSIHRANCANLLRLRDAQPQRVLAVDWGRPSPERTFPVAVAIHASAARNSHVTSRQCWPASTSASAGDPPRTSRVPRPSSTLPSTGSTS
jgi:hypothetical protein